MNKTENDEQHKLGDDVQLPDSTIQDLMDIVDNLHDDVSNTKEFTRACYTYSKYQGGDIAFVVGLMCQHHKDLDILSVLLHELVCKW